MRDRLSDRELRIMAAVVQGYKNRDIAMQLYTSEQMIKNALRNIFDKIGVSDRLELALFVLHHRILAQATASVAAAPSRSRAAAATATPNGEEQRAVPCYSVFYHSLNRPLDLATMDHGISATNGGDRRSSEARS